MPPDNPQPPDLRAGNRVLAALPPEEFERLRPHLEPFEMRAGDVLAHPGDAITHVYFVETGLLSLVASTSAGSTVEVAFVGNEGMAGAVSLLGRPTLACGLVVQLAGRALRVRVEALRDEVLLGGQLLVCLHHYVQILVAQITQAAVCNRFHSPRQRLSRWLAHAFDRAQGDVIPLTHEFIAYMVGGARSLVTQASNELRLMGVIDYRRGSLRVLDADALREQACECYAVVAALVDTR
jgi:CRP-like cAMP-binding protein